MLKQFVQASQKAFSFKLETENRHIGIAYTAFAWFLIALSSVFFTQTRATHSLVNTCFYQYLAAFMAVSLWASFKSRKNFFCKNPFLVLINSLICMVCFYISFSFRMAPASTSNSYLLNSDAIILAVILVVLFKQKIRFLSWLGLILGFVGIMSFFAFEVDFGTFRALSDAIKCSLCAFLLASLILLTSFLLKNNPPIVLALSHCMVGLFCSGTLLYFSGWQLPTNFELFCMAMDGFIYGISLYFFITGLRYVETYIVMSMSYLLPVYLIMINLGLKRGGVDLYTISGMFLVLVSVVIVPIPAYLSEYKRKISPTVQ